MKKDKLWGGILLVAGTTIGAAMLALPTSTGLAGFFPAAGILFLCWLMALWTASLILEVNLVVEGEISLISMARMTLGRPGAAVAWLGFLLLLYALLAAYMTGSGPIFLAFFQNTLNLELPQSMGPWIILILFAPIGYAGIQYVDYMNRYLMAGLCLVYLPMIFLILSQMDMSLLSHHDVTFAPFALSVAITAFGYHTIIPSLTSYLGRDIAQIKKCLFIGSLIPCLSYLLWELAALGVIPLHDEGTTAGLSSGKPISLLLQGILGNGWITTATNLFSALAIITSFLGVAQSLFDFLKDGFHLPSNQMGRLIASFLTYMPPLFFVLFFGQGFISVLKYAGIFVAILIGIFPILMVGSIRYIKKIHSPYQAPGGKMALIAGLLFYIFIIFVTPQV